MDRTPAPWRAIEGPAATVSAPADPGAAGGLAARRRIAAGAAGLAIALAAGAWWLAATSGAASVVDGPAVATPAPSGAVLGDADAGGTIVVEVAGAVAHPGLVRVPADSRVADAIQAAGGLGPRVDVATAARALNLAAHLRDGDQVWVPSRDELRSPDPATGAGSGAVSSAIGKLNLNGATAAELDALPGIGPATAAKIIAAREERPFRSVDELRERKIVRPSTLDQIRNLVTVR